MLHRSTHKTVDVKLVNSTPSFGINLPSLPNFSFPCGSALSVIAGPSFPISAAHPRLLSQTASDVTSVRWQWSRSSMTQFNKSTDPEFSYKLTATPKDIVEKEETAILLLTNAVQWAKRLPGFQDLSFSDQVFIC